MKKLFILFLITLITLISCTETDSDVLKVGFNIHQVLKLQVADQTEFYTIEGIDEEFHQDEPVKVIFYNDSNRIFIFYDRVMINENTYKILRTREDKNWYTFYCKKLTNENNNINI